MRCGRGISTCKPVVIHELCQTVGKSHTREFWALVEKQMPDWKRQHEVLERAAFGDMV
ncbi:M48 family metallopeptidase [Acidovorax sp. sif1233]|uniref:M48 metallopeptidase family protein n=1 Tax=Acidovorax sp. sif1233 TaxID=2854792 RepID=UPI00210824EF|nr:M48 family metallopeptidase [Acidovorax sp. sif1233]